MIVRRRLTIEKTYPSTAQHYDPSTASPLTPAPTFGTGLGVFTDMLMHLFRERMYSSMFLSMTLTLAASCMMNDSKSRAVGSGLEAAELSQPEEISQAAGQPLQ